MNIANRLKITKYTSSDFYSFPFREQNYKIKTLIFVVLSFRNLLAKFLGINNQSRKLFMSVFKFLFRMFCWKQFVTKL